MNAIPLNSDFAVSTPAPARSFTSLRKNFVAALKPVEKVIERKSTIPIISCVRIAAEGYSVKLSGTDLDIVQTVETGAMVHAPFVCYVNAKLLWNVISKAKASHLTLEFIPGEESGKVIVTTDGVATTFEALLPKVPEGQEPENHMVLENAFDKATGVHTFTVPAETFGKAMAFTLNGVSTESTRYYLQGVYMHFLAKEDMGLRGLTFVATDGHRLFAKSIAALIPTTMPGIIIPTKTMKAVIAACEANERGIIKVNLTTTHFRMTMDGVTIISKLIDGTFPEYGRVCPRDRELFFRMPSERLGNVLEQVIASSGRNTPAIRLTFKDSQVAISVSREGQPYEIASLPVEMPEGTELIVGYSGRYLANLCKVFPDGFYIAPQDGGSPALLRGVNSKAEFGVLMPTRI